VKPRLYQLDGLSDIVAALKGEHRPTHRPRIGHSGRARRVVYVLPTGGGKTFVYAQIAQGAASKGKRILILEHRKELIKQAGVALARIDVRHQIIAPPSKVAYCRTAQLKEAGHSMIGHAAAVAVASIQTLARRMDWLDDFRPDIVIVDEAHHAVAGTWERVTARTDYAVHIGVTATPCRTNGQGLRSVYETLILGPSMSDLIADGYLVPPKLWAPPPTAELDDVGIKGGDLNPDQMADILDKPTITGSAVDHYAQHCPGVPAIVFCCNRRHAGHVAETFREAGWRFELIDGTMADAERDRLINGLATGEVQGLCSVDLISEGTDIPRATAAFMLRRTLSESLYLQMGGRVLRPVYAPGFDLDTLEGRLLAIEASGKTHGLLFDHVGNWSRHGKPQAPREWSLEGRPKRPRKKADEEDAEESVQCPQCYHVHDPAPTCPECGHVYIVKPRSGPVMVDGALREIQDSPEDAARRARADDIIRQAKARSRDRIIQEARAEKDRLRLELVELVRLHGRGPTRGEIWAMKPKELRQRIEEFGEDMFMGQIALA
jgi:DNA repair protein RadD